VGKANRPLVVRIKPGETKNQAVARALAKPNAKSRNWDKVLIRGELPRIHIHVEPNEAP